MAVRLGGMGLRSMADVSLAAFIGGVEQSLSYFWGDGVCQQLTSLLGCMENTGHRWRDLLTRVPEYRRGVEFLTA